MKKIILLFCFLALVTPNIYSQFLEENFDYPAGDSLGAHDFVSFSGGAVNRLLVTAPGLTFPDYAGSGIGNATTLANSGQDAYKPLPITVDTGNIYLSAMVNVDTGRTGDYFVGLLSSTSTTNFTGRLYVKQAANGNLAFGISKTTAGSGGIFYSDSIYSTGVTYLLLLKYSFIAGAANDLVSLFIFSTSAPSVEPLPNVGPIGGTGADLTDLGRIALRQGTVSSSPNLRIDGGYLSNVYSNDVLPVELSSFTSTVSGRDILLNWSTITEINNSGFDLERSAPDVSWSKIGHVAGNGTTNSSNNYSYTDRNMASGIYNYRLKQIDFNGNFTYYDLNNEVIIGVPAKFELSQNYPNPFNPSTNLEFGISKLGFVSLKVYNALGKEIITLVNEMKSPGTYTVDFDASGLSSGIYFYTLTSDGFSDTKQMILLK